MSERKEDREGRAVILFVSSLHRLDVFSHGK